MIKKPGLIELTDHHGAELEIYQRSTETGQELCVEIFNDMTVALDRLQVEQIHKYLGRWLHYDTLRQQKKEDLK